MNLNAFDIEELFLAAIKSEIESNQLYSNMAKKTENGLLEDKLKFLAKEEEKHKKYIEDIYMNHYPNKKIILPKTTPVPLPKVEYSEDTALSKLLTQSMNAEKSASEFYKSLADRFEKGTKIRNTLLYFSDMEIGHFNILKMEKESMERFEEADVYWPMVHIGP